MNEQLVVITGANRGIGLELAKAYRGDGAAVVGVCRSASPELADTGAEIVEGVDLREPDSLRRLTDALRGRSIGILVCNAGILAREGLDDLDFESIAAQFEVNAVGPLRVVAALRGQLARGAKIALITSRMGSLEDNTSGGYYGYRMSNAALNAAGRSLAIDLEKQGVAVGIFHPGYVKTRMTNFSGDVSPADAALNLKRRIEELELSGSGQFRHANGQALPW
jgi:NAD(P)-dependent dehydrogenase (short-subunit alcohol dehydrogenase family)